MKNIDHLQYVLGVEVAHSPNGYLLSWTKYCNDAIEREGLTNTKSITNPMKTNLKLWTTDGVLLFESTCYRQVVGSSVYLTITISNVAYAVHVVSQFDAHPASIH